MKLAFSTLACPDWTLEQVVAFASSGEFDGVELRTFGHGSTQIACDPAHTAPAKLLSQFESAGVAACCLATGCRFDEPIFPPVVGRVVTDIDRSVREAKSMIHLAAASGMPYVRVFGFEFRKGDNPKFAERRVIERLTMVVDAARNTGVKVVIENGGSFATGADLRRLLDEVDHPLLGASYNPAVATNAGESPIEGINAIGDRLWLTRLKDTRNGTPTQIGEGDLGCEAFVCHLAERRFSGWIIVDWDKLWMPELADSGSVLSSAASSARRWAASSAWRHRGVGAAH
ncbi:MAG: sugar phosphate isomerase/epimerase [Phycisphaeraceae bacterium]|nr:sugar phosphate isomerase/epimerase [Phycisphaeraceae bacterium]